MACPGTYNLLPNVTDKGFTANIDCDDIFMDEMAAIETGDRNVK
jgi:hypothetical protein